MKQVILITVFTLFATALAAIGYTAWSLFESPAGFSENVVVSIEPGQGTRAITAMLKHEGLIRNARIAELYARLTGSDRGMQAGRYMLSAGMSAAEIISKIHSGDAVFEHIRVTVPEGWMVEEIDAHLASIGLYELHDFTAAVREFPIDSERYPLLDSLPDGVPLEGYLYPETYFILAETSPHELVERMLTELHRRLPADINQQAAQLRMTVHEVLTLASIVQKESPRNDMPEIAGVFWNRIQRRMRLESDATVNYVLGTRNLQPTFADTAVQHPYNTYRNFGLPPGPINNPGLDAVIASLNPVEHDYLFFLHKPTLETVFSLNFADHLSAKARYLD